MKRFSCPVCATEVHYRNTACLTCGTELIFLPATAEMVKPGAEGADPRPCGNRAALGCNWPALEGGLCDCCAATETIPDLSVPGNDRRWFEVEEAKRRLWYALFRLDLGREGLNFHFLGDSTAPDGTVKPVLTGHDHGRITLNIAEADDAEREARRVALGEPYRTLLGHFRHEVGHYYWDRLVKDSAAREGFTRLFGDADLDYGAALEAHYAEGAPADWPQHFVSAYATAHPWEDFAETWAHYLHMLDAMETAAEFGLTPPLNVYGKGPVEGLTDPWIPVSVAMNAMNRALGQADFYPFVLAPTVVEKLGFIHDLVQGRA